MSTGRHSFKHNDAARLIRAVEAAGKTVTGIVLKDGVVTVQVDGVQPVAQAMTRTWQSDPVDLQNRLCNQITQLRDEVERLTEAHERIVEWSRAYPLTIFPKPDLKKARELLEAGGMTLDAISADAMRHVIESVAKISRAALDEGLPTADDVRGILREPKP